MQHIKYGNVTLIIQLFTFQPNTSLLLVGFEHNRFFAQLKIKIIVKQLIAWCIRTITQMI